MNASTWAILALTAGIAGADWFAVGSSIRTLEYVAKPAFMLGLIAAAIAMRPANALERELFIVALVCGLVSDVLLMLPRDLFVGGLAAALLEHLAYIFGFLTRDFHLGLFAVAAGVALASFLVIMPGVYRALRRTKPSLTAPVITYACVIVVMVARAGGTGSGLALAGALLFLYSDSLLAWNRFVRPVRAGRLANMVMYHAGQALLVLSLLT